MEQKLLSGDNYSFKEYFRIWNNPIVFGSVLKWFLFSTLKALIIIVPLLCIIFLAGELDGTLPDERSNMWTFLGTISQRRAAIEVVGLGGSADLTSKYRFLNVRWHCVSANGALGR